MQSQQLARLLDGGAQSRSKHELHPSVAARPAPVVASYARKLQACPQIWLATFQARDRNQRSGNRPALARLEVPNHLQILSTNITIRVALEGACW
jgi:hypothetical protein